MFFYLFPVIPRKIKAKSFNKCACESRILLISNQCAASLNRCPSSDFGGAREEMGGGKAVFHIFNGKPIPLAPRTILSPFPEIEFDD